MGGDALRARHQSVRRVDICRACLAQELRREMGFAGGVLSDEAVLALSSGTLSEARACLRTAVRDVELLLLVPLEPFRLAVLRMGRSLHRLRLREYLR